ncbi:hypothetical protein [Propionivibrio soli]|uniref:hypothetical protein n=1 Tax=Propionivibrio soli TaxID=2976531 RepID=UPI0021E93375|nr:hypothetical protein [Propionivibrio soli]
MPFYRFQIDSPLATQAVLLRVRGLMRESPSILQAIKESFGKRPQGGPPFIGTLDGTTFKMRRDIRYRNSFLPQVHGNVISAPAGSRILVRMNLHPLIAAFILFWLGAVGVGAVAAFMSESRSIQSVLIPAGMFMFGIVLTAGGFYPEAVKARRLLEQRIATGA